MTDSRHDDTDALIDRLKAYIAAMKEEADTTPYPERAERLPKMIDDMAGALSHLEKGRKAA